MRRLVLLALLVCAGWFGASPILAARRLREDARSGDPQRLRRSVDFEAVRENMKMDIRALMADRSETGGALGRAIASTVGGVVADGLVDRLVTPTSIASLVRTARPKARDGSEPAPREEPDVRGRYRSLNAYEIDVVPKEGGASRRVTLHLTRHGLRWRLTRVQMPLNEALAQGE